MIGRRKRHDRPRTRGYDAERSAAGPVKAWLAACAGKDRYTSEAAARAAIGLQLGAPALDTYRCAHCAAWHLTERRPAGQRKAPPPVQVLAFVCSACHARHAAIAVSPREWTPETRRAALLKLEPEAIADGWSITEGPDFCAACAEALGHETYRRTA